MKVEAEHSSYGFWGICVASWVTGPCSVPTVKQQHAIEGGSQVSVISFPCKRMRGGRVILRDKAGVVGVPVKTFGSGEGAVG